MAARSDSGRRNLTQMRHPPAFALLCLLTACPPALAIQ
jgi:hypothetical protein